MIPIFSFGWQHVEIDLGTFTEATLDQEILDRTLEQVERELRARMLPVSIQRTPAPAKVLPMEERWEELFFNFLDTGRMPWWAGKTLLDELERKFAVLLRDDPALQQRLFSFLKSHGIRVRRLILQFDHAWLAEVAKLLLPENAEVFIRQKKHFYKAVAPSAQSEE